MPEGEPAKMSNTPFTDGYFEDNVRSFDDFDRLVLEREERRTEIHGPAPRRPEYLEVQKLDKLLHEALSSIKTICGEWYDFESTCRECELKGAEETLVGKSYGADVYFNIKGQRPITKEDLPHCSKNKERIAAENIKQRICEAFFHYTSCLNILMGYAIDYRGLITSCAALGGIRDRFEMMALNYEIFSPGFTVPPYQLLESMKKGTLEHYRNSGKKGAAKRHAGIQQQYERAMQLAVELWQKPEHRDKLHHQMANFLIDDYVSSNGEVPFSNLKPNSLKNRLKEYLKSTGETEKIFNYPTP